MGIIDKHRLLIQQINELKKKNKSVILVHNYQRPELYEIADFIGDSLELAKKAASTKAAIIVFCGVHFMAETAKLLNPTKKVLLPSLEAGCSLAESITADDVVKLKAAYPNAAVVGYINTSAAVKATCDICCTSSNAEKVVNSLPNEEIIFLPDKNLSNYVASRTDKNIILWEGNCSIHHLLNRDTLLSFKDKYPKAKIIAHPECKKELLDIADYVCSTGGMAKAATDDEAQEFIVVTECGMKEKLMIDVPHKDFLSFCNICPYMKAIDLENVLEAMRKSQFEIEIEELIAVKASLAVQRMIDLT